MAEKISPKEAAQLRNDLYTQIGGVLEDSEPTVDGLTVCLDAEKNIYATVKVTVHDNTKYVIDMKRGEYAEKLQNALDKAAEKAVKAEEKARKAAEKAAEKAEKEKGKVPA